jgi:hypothetical protein
MTMTGPLGGAAELIHDTCDLSSAYKAETGVVLSIEGDFCPACGEAILNREQGNGYREWLGTHGILLKDMKKAGMSSGHTGFDGSREPRALPEVPIRLDISSCHEACR